MSALSLQHLTRRFGEVVAVDAMSLEVARGELICLLGPSGCGKSTALRMVAGFDAPDAGDILIEGQSVLHLSPNKRPTGMVFQSHALWSHMNVFGNIAFGLKLRRLPREKIAADVAEILALVGLQGLENRRPSQLSGGQQQRVALARSLVLKPGILLLDEPFSSLDAHLRLRLREELKAIQRRLGLTMIFVTHDQEEALMLADRIVVVNKGRIEQAAGPDEIYERPASLFVAEFIGTMNVLPASFTGGRLLVNGLDLTCSPEQQAGIAAITAPGGGLTLAVRPEDIEVQAAISRENAFLIEGIAKLGPVRLASLRNGKSETIRAQIQPRAGLDCGMAVSISLRRFLLYGTAGRPVEIILGCGK